MVPKYILLLTFYTFFKRNISILHIKDFTGRWTIYLSFFRGKYLLSLLSIFTILIYIYKIQNPILSAFFKQILITPGTWIFFPGTWFPAKLRVFNTFNIPGNYTLFSEIILCSREFPGTKSTHSTQLVKGVTWRPPPLPNKGQYFVLPSL